MKNVFLKYEKLSSATEGHLFISERSKPLCSVCVCVWCGFVKDRQSKDKATSMVLMLKEQFVISSLKVNFQCQVYLKQSLMSK